MRQGRPRILVLTALAAAALAGPALAQPGRFAPRGYYLGLSANDLALKGDLDGRLVLVNAYNRFYIPRPAEGTGWGAWFGVDVRRGFWRISLQGTSHRARFAERPASRASYYVLALDGFSYLVPSWSVTPYVEVGVDIPWMRVRDGTLTRDHGLRQATYVGLGAHAGLGVCARLGPDLFLSAGVTERFNAIMYAYGQGKGRDVANLKIGDSLEVQPRFLGVLGTAIVLSIGWRI